MFPSSQVFSAVFHSVGSTRYLTEFLTVPVSITGHFLPKFLAIKDPECSSSLVVALMTVDIAGSAFVSETLPLPMTGAGYRACKMLSDFYEFLFLQNWKVSGDGWYHFTWTQAFV